MDNQKKKIKNRFIIICIILFVISFILGLVTTLNNNQTGSANNTADSKGPNSNNEKPNPDVDDYLVADEDFNIYEKKPNSLVDFDLAILKQEAKEKNLVYSPISTKYALSMLLDASNGNTKEQILSVLGTYNVNKYANNKNRSISNALFIRDTYAQTIHKEYQTLLKDKYNAQIIYDSFSNADKINKWISNNTFKMIENIMDDNTVNNLDYILTNTIAIDMQWVNTIEAVERNPFSVNYQHINYHYYTPMYNTEWLSKLDFEGVSNSVKALKFGAVINRYNLVEEIGEENIRKTVGEAYDKWKAECLLDESCKNYEKMLDTNEYLDKYISEIDKAYLQYGQSTDFKFYVDNEVKAFSKELQEYTGTTLEYVAIMPKKDTLSNYIKDLNSEKINYLINNLKDIQLENFKDNVITEINAFVPLYNFENEIDLKTNLQPLGITDLFDSSLVDLSFLSKNATVDILKQNTKIEFSNFGIKAAAATIVGGAGAAGGGFDYLYDVPVEKIDLTFDRPFIFLIKDKDTGEVWFTGQVYSPTLY